MSKNKQPAIIEASATEQAKTATEVPVEPTTFDNTGITPQTVMNFAYTTDEATQKDLTEIVEALKPKTKVHVRTVASEKQHDLIVLEEGRTVLRVCPLRARISSSLPGDKGKILNHTKASILKAIEKME